MRSPLVLLAATALAACAVSNPGTPPDKTRFYYPTGIAWLPGPDGGGSGFIYVASSDFDLRFNRGTIASVDVAALEPFMDAGPPATTPPTSGIFAPHSDRSFISSIVTIDPFAGPLSTFRKPDGTVRLFVAGRENNVLESIDVLDDGGLVCAALDGGTDCFTNGVVLATGTSNQVRDAYRPLATTDGQVFVSGITPIDHPYGSNTNYTAALAQVNGLTLGSPGFIQIGFEASDGLAQVGRLLYISGRAFAGDTNTAPLQRLNLDDPGMTLTNSNLPYKSNVFDGRAIAASSDASRLFLVVRDPEALLTLDMTAGADGWPNEQVLNEVELPPGASELVVLSRGPGRPDVVAITCADDGSVALYDDQLGVVEAVVHGLGSQPFGIAAGANPNAPGGARLFVTAFGNGGVAVVELPSLDDLTQARVALTFGADENCLNDDVIARPPGCPKVATP